MTEAVEVHPDDDGRELVQNRLDENGQEMEEMVPFEPWQRYAHFDYLKNEYKYKRKEKYPEIVDQLDAIYNKGIDGWKAEIKAIKDEFPKLT